MRNWLTGLILERNACPISGKFGYNRISALRYPAASSQPSLVATPKTIGSIVIQAAIARIAAAISVRHTAAKRVILLGIANGGITLAQRLATHLRWQRTGTLDISFHRDDIGRHPIPKEFAPTALPGDVTGATIILVDDVLFTGRTVKAALDELFDHGRPAQVELAVLVDRGGRLMPVAADYTGIQLTATADEKIVVSLDPVDPARDFIQVKSTAAVKSNSQTRKSKIS